MDNDCDGTPDDNACRNGLKCSNNACVQCVSDTDCNGGKCNPDGTCCVPDCGNKCGGKDAKCGTTCTRASCAEDEMCSGDICVAETRDCTADNVVTCNVFGAKCENRAKIDGARYDLCRFPNGQATCANAGGMWTEANSMFAMNNPGVVPAQGACLSEASNLSCDPGEISHCGSVGATCDKQVDVNGGRRDLCRWGSAFSGATCPMPGIWTTPDSDFARIWPRAVPPGRNGACITQVTNF